MFLTVAPIQSQSTQGLRRLNPHGTASNELVQWKGRVSFICTVRANYVSTWTEKLQMQLLCHLSRQGWTAAAVVCGDAKLPATDTTASPEHCCKNCHSNREVKSHHSYSPRATLATCWKAYWLQNPVSCVQLHEWHSPLVPSGTNILLRSSVSSAVLHPVSFSHQP